MFINEAIFQTTLHIARMMLSKGIIKEQEYRDLEQEMIRKYQPFSGDLYA